MTVTANEILNNIYELGQIDPLENERDQLIAAIEFYLSDLLEKNQIDNCQYQQIFQNCLELI